MAEERDVEKELETVAKNLKVFVGKGKGTEEALRHLGVAIEQIPESAGKEVRRAAKILEGKAEPSERASEVCEILGRLSDDEKIPEKIRTTFIDTAMKRLGELRGCEVPLPETGGIPGVPYGLELFISDDKKVEMRRKRMGITAIPAIVREAAVRAQETLSDANLGERERAIQAADILMEPLQPAVFGTRDRKDLLELQNEVKCALWEVANALTCGAASKS